MRGRKRACASAVLAAAVWTTAAQAGLTYDLRFTDGTRTKVPSVGTTYQMDLWARVSGTDANSANDGLTTSYVAIQSGVTSGGAFPTGGITGGSVVGPFNDPLSSRNGAGADLNADGVSDWGSTSTSINHTGYLFARTTTTGGEVGGGSVGQAVNASTWEFKIATYNVVATSISRGVTTFNIIKPNATLLGGVTYAQAKVDGATFNVDSANQQGAYTGSVGTTFGPLATSGDTTFTGGPSNISTTWNTAANWSSGGVPTQYDTAILSAASSTAPTITFDFTTTNNGTKNQAISMLRMGSAAAQDITLKGGTTSGQGTLTLLGVGGVALENLSASRKLTLMDTPLAALHDIVSLNGSVNVQQPGGTIDLGMVVAGNVTKTGAGTLIMEGVGASLFTGNVNLTAGTFQLLASFTNAGTLAVSSGTTALLNANLGGTFTLNNEGTVNASVTQTILSLNSIGSTANLNYIGVPAATFTISSGSYSGSITGGVKLIKGSVGVLSLYGTNTYTGGNDILAGVLEGSTSAIRGNVNNTNGTLRFDQATEGTYAGAISGAGQLAKIGAGIVHLTSTSTFSGATTITAGKLMVDDSNALQNSSIINVNVNDGLGFGAATAAIQGLGGTGNVNVGSAAVTVGNANNATYAGTISGAGSLTKVGTGKQIVGALRNAAVTASAGTLAVAQNGSNAGVSYINSLSIAGAAALDLNDNDLVVNSGTFSSILGLVFQGYSASPDSTKTGIISTTGQGTNGTTILAVFNNALTNFAVWPPGSGQSIGAAAVVGKYTYLGDTNMDGQVTPQDYTAVDSNLGTSGIDLGIAWFLGDTNFDGNVTAQDYTAVDSALGLGTGNPLAASAVPEVGSIGGMLIAAGGLIGRRRSRDRI
jgi:autotransporter-associated beta strand protein